MKFYPVCLDLRKRPCLVVGGGRVAERKARSLLEAGAQVTLVSPSLTEELQELSLSGSLTHRKKLFEEADIAGACIVIAATNSPQLNTAIGKLCREKQILVNVAAPPEESTFIVPSVVNRGDLLIAISTGGSSPALSRKIRGQIEHAFGPEYGLFLERMATVRAALVRKVPEEPARRAVFQAIVDSDVLDLLKEGNVREADERIAKIAGIKMQ